MTLTIELTTATGEHPREKIPRDLEGDTAVESAANFLREIADQQKMLPERLRAFRPPLTIVIEELEEVRR